MTALAQLGNSKTQYRLQVNPADYTINPDLAPISSFRRVISYEADINPVQMDAARVALVFNGLRSKDHKYYFYILARLVRNDLPIKCDHKQMRDTLQDTRVQIVAEGIERLVQAGLIFRAPNRRGEYIVNPVFAWKGNQLDYLDLSTFEDHT